MANSTHALFCDETGNTGSRFLDPAQPIYAEGGWFVAHKHQARVAQAILALEAEFLAKGAEVKGAELTKSSHGQAFLRRICERVGKTRGVPFIMVVEKRYFVCSKIVETFFDPDYNARIPVAETWDPEKRQGDAELFYGKDESLIIEFAEAYRLKDSARMRTNAENWVTLLRAAKIDEQAERVAGVLPNIEEEIETERKHLASGRFPSGMDSLNLPIVMDVFQFIEQKCPYPCDLVHDQTASFEPLYEYVFGLFSQADPLALEMKDGRRFHMGFKNALSLSFEDSKTSPLIRAADYVVAGTRRFIQLALSDASIPAELTHVAFGMLGSLILNAYAALNPSVGGTPELAKIMASRRWAGKILARLHREMQATLTAKSAGDRRGEWIPGGRLEAK